MNKDIAEVMAVGAGARVAIVIPSLSHGGAERVASLLANVWVPIVKEVHVITLSGLQQFYDVDRRVRLFNASAGVASANRLGSCLVALRVRAYVARSGIDTVLSFMDKYNIFTLIALAGLNVKVNVSERSSPAKQRRLWLRVARRLCYPFANSVISQTSAAKNLLTSEIPGVSAVVIPNPVRAVEVTDRDREKLILSVGRLVPEKGHALLLRSFALLNDQDWKLAIVGSGPLRDDLLKLAAELGVSARVVFVEATRNIDFWYSTASIFVLSSISEGFPNALLEAMAAGLPCVSFDCSAGPAEIIDDGISGVLIPPGDISRLAWELDRLVRSPSLRRALSMAAVLRASDFRAEHISMRYLRACLG